MRLQRPTKERKLQLVGLVQKAVAAGSLVTEACDAYNITQHSYREWSRGKSLEGLGRIPKKPK